MNFDLEGSIHATAIPHLIHAACSTRETGILRLTDQVEKSVYIKEGQIVFATSTDRDDRLGQVLLRSGELSIERLVEATEKSLQEGSRLGKVLVEAGWLEPEELVRGVVGQVREILLSIFSWTSGSYQLVFGELPTRELITLNVNTGDILLEGIRRIHSWYRIHEALGGLDVSYKQRDGIEATTARLTLDELEVALLARLEHPVTLRDLCRWSPMNDFEIGRILWGFLVTGLVVRAAGARAPGAA